MDRQAETDAVRVARQAADVLGNEAYKKAMASMKSQIVDQWREAPIRDREGQMVLLQLAKIAEKFEGILAGYIEGGKLAQRRLDLDAERNENAAQRAARKVGRAFRREND
jgi:hypothetical protein